MLSIWLLTILEAAKNLEPKAMPRSMRITTAMTWPIKTASRASFFGQNILFCAKGQERERL
jgi:hypothetical protein